MTPIFMIKALHEEMKKIIGDYKFPGEKKGDFKNINIYDYDLPRKKQIDKKDSPVPYLIIDIIDGNIDSETDGYRVSVGLVFCCSNKYDDQNGKQDLLNIFDKIIVRFRANPVFEEYRVLLPLKWVIETEDTYPFAVGAMQITIEIPDTDREDLLT